MKHESVQRSEVVSTRIEELGFSFGLWFLALYMFRCGFRRCGESEIIGSVVGKGQEFWKFKRA